MPHGSPIRSDQPWRDVQLAGEGNKVDGGQAKVVDVREKASYDAEHVKGAVNIPYTDAQTRVSEFPKTGSIILYCQ